MEKTLRIAIQKKGRLSEKSLEIIRNCGIDFPAGTGKLRCSATNFPIEFLYLRDDDIPGYVEDGVADIGIVGKNVFDESRSKAEIEVDMGFSKCRLSIAVPNAAEYKGINDLEGKMIATSYPNILGNYLKENGVNADIHEISGSVEIAPTIGLTDAICDIVSTGSTLMSNGLKEVEKIYFSTAVMIRRKELEPEKKDILNRLLRRIGAVKTAKKNKYLLFNIENSKLDKVVEMIPGMKSPSVLPLAMKGWSSVQTVINEDKFWEMVEKLGEMGAEGILVTPIEKMII